MVGTVSMLEGSWFLPYGVLYCSFLQYYTTSEKNKKMGAGLGSVRATPRSHWCAKETAASNSLALGPAGRPDRPRITPPASTANVPRPLPVRSAQPRQVTHTLQRSAPGMTRGSPGAAGLQTLYTKLQYTTTSMTISSNKE